MKQVNQEDWLDRELREAAVYRRQGFTARVLQQLPPPGAVMICCVLHPSGNDVPCECACYRSGGGRFVSITLERLAACPRCGFLLACQRPRDRSCRAAAAVSETGACKVSSTDVNRGVRARATRCRSCRFAASDVDLPGQSIEIFRFLFRLDSG
jgi:hypothetical protein